MVQTFILLIFSTLSTVGAHICFKQGVSKLGELNFSLSNALHLFSKIFQNAWLVLGIFLFGTSFILWLFIISKVQLNFVYPITIAAQIILLAIASWLIFHEYLATWQIVGIAVIILGIFLLKP